MHSVAIVAHNRDIKEANPMKSIRLKSFALLTAVLMVSLVVGIGSSGRIEAAGKIEISAPSIEIPPCTFTNAGVSIDETNGTIENIDADTFVSYYSTNAVDFNCIPSSAADFYVLSWALFINSVASDGQAPRFEDWATAQSPFCELAGDNAPASYCSDGDRVELRDAKVDEFNQTDPTKGVAVDEKSNMLFYNISVNPLYEEFIENGFFLKKLESIPADCNNYNAALNASLTSSAQSCFQSNFGTKYNLASFPNGSIEAKMSWRIAEGGGQTFITDTSKYYTISAQVPDVLVGGQKTVEVTDANGDTKTFNVTEIDVDDNTTSNPPSKVTLALVGFHLVWTHANNPSFVWATFTHNDTTYTNNCSGKSGYLKENGYDKMSYVAATLSASDPTVKSYPAYSVKDPNNNDQPLTPLQVCQLNPYGGAPDTDRTAIDTLNEKIPPSSKMPTYFGNYILTGAQWQKPQDLVYVYNVKNSNDSIAGGPSLANTTMETFTQTNAYGCFTCHQAKLKLVDGLPDQSKITSFNVGLRDLSNIKNTELKQFTNSNLPFSHMFNKYNDILAAAPILDN